VQAVDQRGDLQQADHRQVAGQVALALGAIEDGEGQDRADHHVDRSDQQEQVAPARHEPERARIPDEEHQDGSEPGDGSGDQEMETRGIGARAQVKALQHRGAV
jgi:hypothetical protein